MLLDQRNFLRRDFHPQVAACHHDRMRDFENGVQVFDGLRLLQLGDQTDIAAMLRDGAPRAQNILGGTHERYGDQVHSLRQTKLQVDQILLGQRRNAHVGARQIDALVLAQHAAVQDFADDLSVTNSRTTSSIRPSDSRMRSPGFTSLARL